MAVDLAEVLLQPVQGDHGGGKLGHEDDLEKEVMETVMVTAQYLATLDDSALVSEHLQGLKAEVGPEFLLLGEHSALALAGLVLVVLVVNKVLVGDQEVACQELGARYQGVHLEGQMKDVVMSNGHDCP